MLATLTTPRPRDMPSPWRCTGPHWAAPRRSPAAL